MLVSKTTLEKNHAKKINNEKYKARQLKNMEVRKCKQKSIDIYSLGFRAYPLKQTMTYRTTHLPSKTGTTKSTIKQELK